MEQANDRSRGTVKWFNNTKGFGFISPDDGGEDLFVHQSSIKAEGYRTLTEGEIVEFMVTEGDDGRIKAVDVTGPDGSNVQGGGGGGGGGGDGRREGFGGGRGGGSWGGGYGGGRGRGGGSYGGGGACYNCGETGHFAKDCHQGSGGGGGGAACYNCGEMGHLARDCSQGGGSGSRRYGGGGGGNDRSCYNCGEMGHIARECPGKV